MRRRFNGAMSAPETPTLRATAIAGERVADDYAVMWRGMLVGRIRLGNGAPHDQPQWVWSCHVHGRPQGSDDRGNAANLVDAKARFKNAWARIRASLTDQDIADAQQIAAVSAKALARYDQRALALKPCLIATGNEPSTNRSRCRTVASFERFSTPGAMSPPFLSACTNARSGKR
jgi:hypothetical protein